MSRTPRWRQGNIDNGILEVTLSSWKYFADYINNEMLEHVAYVYRGHANSTWKLEPTLDRVIKDPASTQREDHLTRFKFETRGRRGSNPPLIENENDWWALGQHHGLNTPLLDWTESPFVALFFAASSAQKEKTKNLSVFAFYQGAPDRINKRINENDEIELVNNHKPTVKIVRPLSDENKRLVSQRGLFTRGPNNINLEAWVRKFNCFKPSSLILLKITIPNTDISNCLRFLNRMNINHSTLLPDLMGASEFCNSHLITDRY